MHRIKITSKKDRKLEQIKALALNCRNGISRREIAEATELDIRTATAYIDELCQSGLLRPDNASASGKGRPATVYFPNLDRMIFIGIALSRTQVDFIVTDFDSNVLLQETPDLNLTFDSKLRLFNIVLEFIEKIKNKFADKDLISIGIAFSRWLQPPLAAMDVYSDLPDAVANASGVPVFRTIRINASVYGQWEYAGGSGNLIIVHPGIVLELGILQNGEVPENHQQLEYEFSHHQIAETPRCYCGKTGCLENFVTIGAMRETFREELKKSGGDASLYTKFEEKLLQNDPLALKVVSNAAVKLAKGLKYLIATYKPEKIILFSYGNFFEETVTHLTEKEKKIVHSPAVRTNDTLIGSASMACRLSVKQYINESDCHAQGGKNVHQ